MAIRTLVATRYLTPLREGGSLPAVVECDDGQLYVMKFVGAGQGRKALIAELVAGELARILGLHVPEIVLIDLDPALAPSESDPEIHDLLRASAGMNLGLGFLPKALMYSPLLAYRPDPDLASAIVWFDAYVTNPDRTLRNVNLLLWQGDLWLIDHGAALYFHHQWNGGIERCRSPFPLIRHHTLLRYASRLGEADAVLKPRLTPDAIRGVVAQVPESWLVGEKTFASIEAHRQAYVDYLLSRLDASAIFVNEAIHARAQAL